LLPHLQDRRYDAHHLRPPRSAPGCPLKDRQPPPPQESAPRDPPLDPGPGPHACPAPATPPGTTLTIGPILVQTVRPFFPDLDDWLDDIADPRFLPCVTYDKRFLLWWGLSLFLCKLGSRRQLDYQFNSDGPAVLDNLNRLAGTAQTTRPVNQTLNYFLGRIGAEAVARLRTQLVRRLIRMKALDAARLQGRFVVAIAIIAWCSSMARRPCTCTRCWRPSCSGQPAW